VVGGAIGGLAAARALAACEAEVTVLERRPEGAGEGAGLLLYPPAGHALERLGALEAFERGSVVLAGIQTFDHRGRLLYHFDATGFAAKYGHPLRGVNRGDLLAALEFETRRGITVTDVKVADEVRARTEQGWLTADVLVGADGIRSRVREALGLGAEPRRTGWVAWRGVAPAPPDLDRTLAAVVVGRGRHGGWLPVAGDRVYWFLTGDAGETRIPAEVEKWAGPLPGLIASTDPGVVLFNELLDRDPDSRWGRGAVTLVGDAAHAMLPSMAQGANQALEDAAVLLEEMRKHGVGTQAFRAYERRRAGRTARVVKLSRQVMPVFQWRRLPARWLRARLLALPQSLTEGRTEWLYRGDAGPASVSGA